MSISSIIYNNQYEWTHVRDNLYNTINNSLIKCIIDDKYEYEQMSCLGLTEKQRIYLTNMFEEQLFKITLNEEWASNTTFNIIYGIQGFFEGLIKTGKFFYILKSLEPIQLVEILFENIKWQLDDDYHIPCYLEDIPKYRCPECNRIVDIIYNNKCDNC